MADDTKKNEEETSEATEETSEATQETSEATEETSEATQETSEATQETSEATAETSEATQETSEATQETSEATQETSETTAETSEATQETAETSEATQESSEATVETSEATQETAETTEEATDAAGSSEKADESDAEDAAEAAGDSEEDASDIAGDGIDAGRRRPSMPVEQADLEDEEAQRNWSEEDDRDEEAETELTVEAEKVTGDEVAGVAAYFDHPDHLLYAASETRESKYQEFEAFSPFPIHGMDDAMGLGRSWIPWVTFGAGGAGLLVAIGLQFGIMGYDWPMVYGGKPFIAWPSFVPIMFELTVLFAGVTTGVVMLKAAGCFKKPFIVDRDITKDRFVLWISAEDEYFKQNDVIEFVKGLNPSEIRTVRKDG